MVIIRVRFGSGAVCDYVARDEAAVRQAAWNHSVQGIFGSDPIGGVVITEKKLRASHDARDIRDALTAVSHGGTYALMVSDGE